MVRRKLIEPIDAECNWIYVLAAEAVARLDDFATCSKLEANQSSLACMWHEELLQAFEDVSTLESYVEA